MGSRHSPYSEDATCLSSSEPARIIQSALAPFYPFRRSQAPVSAGLESRPSVASSRPVFSGPSARIGRVYWLLAATQACHSAEEMASGLYDFFWVVTGRVHQAWAGFPQMRMDPKTFAILN